MKINEYINDVVGCGVIEELDNRVNLELLVKVVEKYKLKISDNMWCCISKRYDEKMLKIEEIISNGLWDDDESDELRVLWDKMRMFKSLVDKYGVDEVIEKSKIKSLKECLDIWNKYEVFKLRCDFDIVEDGIEVINYFLEMREKYNIDCGYCSNEDLKKSIEEIRRLKLSCGEDDDMEDEE